MGLIRLCLLAALIGSGCCFSQVASGQCDRTTYVKNEDGDVIQIHYAGTSEWLLKQTDKCSRWAELPKLTTIAISHTTVTRQQLEYIATLPHVEEIHISCLPEEIELPGPALTGLKGMKSLKSLDVVNDSFADDDWTFLSELPALEKLTIRGCVDGQVLADALPHTKIRDLTVRGIDNLNAESAERLSVLPSLREVRLGIANDSHLLLKHLHENSRIADLAIHAPALHAEELNWIGSMASLESVDISGVCDSDSLPPLSKLKKLKFLRIRFTTRTELDDLAFLKELGSLESLFLPNGTRVNAGGSLPAGIRGLANLVQLDIGSVNLNSEAIEDLAAMPKLRFILIGNSERSDLYRSAIRRLPTIKIEGTAN